MNRTTDSNAWCRYLNWNGQAVDLAGASRVADVSGGGCTFTCGRTAQPVGVDDQVAAPETCTESRSCYVHHPLFPLLQARACMGES